MSKNVCFYVHISVVHVFLQICVKYPPDVCSLIIKINKMSLLLHPSVSLFLLLFFFAVSLGLLISLSVIMKISMSCVVFLLWLGTNLCFYSLKYDNTNP